MFIKLKLGKDIKELIELNKSFSEEDVKRILKLV